MTQTNLAKILTRRYDVGREIKFILYKDELLSDPIDLTDYTVVITVIKPDNNFVIENFSGDTVTITDQMEVVTGTGYYCVHVSKDNETIYTGQGEFIIDDVLISDDELDSISEVNGLKFPDDFITVEDHVAVIDDTVTTTEKTWSSSKISDEIENVSVVVSKTAEGNPVELTDAADAPLVKCATQITGSQDLHGYGKPWVGGAGKNLIDDESLEMRDVTGTGTMRASLAPVQLSAGTYTLSYVSKSPTLGLYITIIDDNYASTVVNDSPTSFTITSTKNVMIRSSAGATSAWDVVDIQLEKGSQATSYAPYSNICPITAYTEGEIGVTDGNGNTTTHTTDYPSAIYRGSEDVVNGEMTTAKIKVSKKWSEGTSATVIGDYTRKVFSLPSDAVSNDTNAICNVAPRILDYTSDALHFYVATSTAFVFLPNDTDGNTDIEIAYELATPATSSVTPSNLPIKSISGYTHIESSTGNMEIEYITQDYQPLVDSIVMDSERKITKLWDAGFTPAPGVWLEYDFGEDLENYDAIVILFVVSGWEGNNSDSVTVYPKIQNLNTTKYYHYIKGADYGIQFWHVSGTTYGLGSIDGNYPPQYKAVYGIKY